MDDVKETKEYLIENCSYLVSRECGKEDAGDIIMEKLTGEISPSQNWTRKQVMI